MKEDFSEEEVWKDIENSNHQISNFGNVKNKGTLNKIISRNRLGKLKPKILKNRLSENKYFITFNNYLIHRLVATYFISNPLKLLEVNHKDGNKLNNHYSNLEWCTRSENVNHAFINNLNKGAIGELSGSSKLKEIDIIEIKKLYNEESFTYKDLSEKFSVSSSQIGKIIRNEQWKHL